MPDWLIRTQMVLHKAILRLSRGRLGVRYGRRSFLLLHTTGRRSGRERVIPIAYFATDDYYFLVASNWGKEKNAAWYWNLKAHPQALVEVRGRKIPVTASEAAPSDYERLWKIALGHNPEYAAYRRETTRHIPIVILRPRVELR